MEIFLGLDPSSSPFNFSGARLASERASDPLTLANLRQEGGEVYPCRALRGPDLLEGRK